MARIPLQAPPSIFQKSLTATLLTALFIVILSTLFFWLAHAMARNHFFEGSHNWREHTTLILAYPSGNSPLSLPCPGDTLMLG